MKKIIFTIAAVVFFPYTVFSGGIFVNSQQSAEYMRLFNRNAATDNADIAYYNMGGTVKLEDGQYFNGSNMFYFQKATVESKNNAVVGDRKYTSDNSFLIFPNFYYVNKLGGRAFFCAYQTIGATAVREWEDGLPTLDFVGKTFLSSTGNIDSYLKGESAYYCFRVGGARKINDIFSFGVSARYVYTMQKIEGNVSNDVNEKELIIDAEDSGDGFSFSLNLNISPIPDINIGATYEHTTKIELETKVKGADNEEEIFGVLMDPVFINGRKSRLDLPQILRMGISWQMTPQLRTETSFNVYFEDNVNFSYLGDNYKNDYSNTYEFGACIEYEVSDRLKVSSGFVHNWIGQDKDSTTDISVPGGHANYITLAGGFEYGVRKNTLLNFGMGYTGFVDTYENSDMTDLAGASKEYNKQYIVMAFGINYKF